MLKRCIYCLNDLFLENFSKDRSRKDGLNPRCRDCYKKEKKNFWKENRSRILKNRKIHYHKNKEVFRAKARNSYDKHKEKRRLKMRLDRTQHPKKYKQYQLKRDFGIGFKEFEQMNNEQGGLCKICKQANSGSYKYLAVDHCHKTMKIRGLLCENCNKGLGMFKDNENFLMEAVRYLKANNEK